MTDRDRLIELVDKAKEEYANDITDHTETDYIVETLLNEGVIVTPCKVGQTVYRITKLYGGKTIIAEGEAFEFAITHEHRFYFWGKGEEFIYGDYSLWCDFADFGKTVFLTKEEAEAELEKRGKENA